MLPTEQAAQADPAHTLSTPFQDPLNGSWVRLMVMRPTGQSGGGMKTGLRQEVAGGGGECRFRWCS